MGRTSRHAEPLVLPQGYRVRPWGKDGAFTVTNPDGVVYHISTRGECSCPGYVMYGKPCRHLRLIEGLYELLGGKPKWQTNRKGSMR